MEPSLVAVLTVRISSGLKKSRDKSAVIIFVVDAGENLSFGFLEYKTTFVFASIIIAPVALICGTYAILRTGYLKSEPMTTGVFKIVFLEIHIFSARFRTKNTKSKTNKKMGKGRYKFLGFFL